MPGNHTLKVVLCWHMHQPEYRDFSSGEYQLPWVYLHAIKDYVDMVSHLEMIPEARAVVNFTPVLIVQVADYARQLREFLSDNRPLSDPLLAALVTTVLPTSAEQRILLIKSCLNANEDRLIKRYPAYQALVAFAHQILGNSRILAYFSEQYLADLLVWYHLAWLGETIKRSDKRIQALIAKSNGYTLADRLLLLEILSEILNSIIPRYAALAKRGQIELSVTPYAHPMLPLMLDFNAARDALPHIQLPDIPAYPGSEYRACWHLHEGINIFKAHFGIAPQGCWPAEGGVSQATLKLLAEHHIRWTASGEGVLRNTLNHLYGEQAAKDPHAAHKSYCLEGTPIRCFFRDDGLSDLIGFSYSKWHADDAVGDLVHALEKIAQTPLDVDNRVVSIILDGENAWEYYPENGYYFLHTLYKRLANHPQLELTTFSECWATLDGCCQIPHIQAGSWVYGNFATWIGDTAKNRGWEMLVEAKQAFDQVMAANGNSNSWSPEKRELLERQLAICEGSDWFWWFGDYNPAQAVNTFDRLFRLHLTNLYRYLGLSPPEYLAKHFSSGSDQQMPDVGGVMRRGKA